MKKTLAALPLLVLLGCGGSGVPAEDRATPAGPDLAADASQGPDGGAVAPRCEDAPVSPTHPAATGTATFDEPAQDLGVSLYRQFVYDPTKPLAEQLPVRWSRTNDPAADRSQSSAAPGAPPFEPSYLVYQIRASRQDIAHETVSGRELGSHVGMGIVRRQVRFIDARGVRDEGILARARAPREASSELRWPDETTSAGRLVDFTSVAACEVEPNTRVLYMNNHGSALRYRYFDWDRSRLGAPGQDGAVTWGGPMADRSQCPTGRCVAQALYKATHRASAHPEIIDDTKADSSKVIAEAFVPLVHDPFAAGELERLRARAELARVGWMDRCLSFRPLRDDRVAYRRGAGVSGFCDAQCGHDGYTVPGGLAPLSTGWVHRGFGESVRRLRSFTAQDVEGDTLGYGSLLTHGSVGYYYAGRRLLSVFGFTLENTDAAWYASYPASGHNSNTDAEAQVAMFRFCAAAAETAAVADGEPLEAARRWADLEPGDDDGVVGTMAARISSSEAGGSGVATVCEEVCRGGRSGRPTRASGYRNAAGIWTAKSNAAFASSSSWPPDELSNVIWSGAELQELWDTRRLYAYKKRVDGFVSGPFLLDNEQAADVPRNPLAGHHAYRALVRTLDPQTEDDSGVFRYRPRASAWPVTDPRVGPSALHPMAERTHYDEVVQAVVRGGAAVDPTSRWISNDADLTGSAAASATNDALMVDGDVRSCQLYVGRALPVPAGTRCKLVRGM